MSPMQELIIHVGARKAGSSSLQKYFHVNAGALAQSSVCYPSAGRSKRVSLTAHHNLGFSIREDLRGEWFRDDEGDWPDALDEIEASGSEWGVISTESLWDGMRDVPTRVREVTKGIPVRIVAFLRRQDQYVESSYNQKARFGREPGEIVEAFERRPYDFDHGTVLGAGPTCSATTGRSPSRSSRRSSATASP